PQLGHVTTDGRQRDRRRAQRATAQGQLGRRRLELERRADREARSGERGAPALPLLAPALLHRTQPDARLSPSGVARALRPGGYFATPRAAGDPIEPRKSLWSELGVGSLEGLREQRRRLRARDGIATRDDEERHAGHPEPRGVALVGAHLGGVGV